MLELLQGHLPLALGATLAILLIALRAVSRDSVLRDDLRGAIVLLVAFLALRTLRIAIVGHLPTPAIKALEVSWMLLFAFGLIRAVVSVTLWFFRFRGGPMPKILRDVIDFSLYFLAAVPIVKSELEIDLTGVMATSAILSVVIGLALQDTLGNLFAGLSIQLERPFQVGDIVTIEEHTGRIVQVAWRATRLETARRELITLPNSILSKHTVKNYTRAGVAVGIDVYFGASYAAPPNRVKEAVLDALRDVPYVLQDPKAVCRVDRYEDSAIQYKVRVFIADHWRKDAVLDEIYSRLWYRFRRDAIEIPFPTRTVHLIQPQTAPEVSTQSIDTLLSSVDLFQVLGEIERQQLARSMTVHKFGRGERIIEQGAAGHTFYLVSEGEVAVSAGKPEVEVTRLTRGQYFGEMSLLTGEPRAATVIAATDATLLELDRPIFARLFSDHPGLARKLSALLAERRLQLRAVTEATATADNAPEANRIFGRLRQIFGLSQD